MIGETSDRAARALCRMLSILGNSHRLGNRRLQQAGKPLETTTSGTLRLLPNTPTLRISAKQRVLPPCNKGKRPLSQWDYASL